MSGRDEAWETQSGLSDDFDFEVIAAKFEVRANYNEGRTPVIVLYGKSDDPDVDVDEVFFSVGTGWNVIDKGERVVHEKGRKKFIKSSAYGRLIERAVELAPEVFTSKRGLPTEAKVWQQTKWHFKRETVHYGGEISDKEILLPNRFLGLDGELPKSESAKPATSTESSAPSVQSAGASGTPSVRDQLKGMVALLDPDQFKAAAIQIPGVISDPALLQEVLATGENSFWAKTKTASA